MDPSDRSSWPTRPLPCCEGQGCSARLRSVDVQKMLDDITLCVEGGNRGPPVRSDLQDEPFRALAIQKGECSKTVITTTQPHSPIIPGQKGYRRR